VKPENIKLIIFASPQSIKHLAVRGKTGWFEVMVRVRLMV